MSRSRLSFIGGALGVAWLVVIALAWWSPPLALLLSIVLGFGTAIALVYVYWRIVWPVEDLAQRAEQLAAGGEDTLNTPIKGSAEAETLRRALDAMAGHVRRAHQEGRAHAVAISEAEENERARLAHELHDATVQSLIAVAQRLDRASRAATGDAVRAQALIGEARQDIAATITGLREIIADLRPPALDELGLVPALELMVERLPPTPPVRLIVEGAARRLDPDRELAALRVVQEALSNVQRHAQASEAEVRLRFEPVALHIIVEDDGRGFAPTLPDDGTTRHWGLVGLHERASRFGGTVRIDSAPGAGTRLHITLPDRAVPQPIAAVVDPVCHATIQPDTAYGSVVHNGTEYFFCCPVCQGAFQRDPAHYS
jgi:signal transduction histidine kinase/YHS domain-containing protein